ncbi:MAG: hypothetical protein WBI05_13655 [Rhodoferax sp.]|uniref:hypothetical protein n=1 Tax=Rhodoferax sp. TaxID=50421 RepID=UPI003BB490CF|nr:DUF4276 family protein [Rhodoferax sp.]
MTPIAIATEDQLSEAIALRLIADIPTPHFIQHKLGKTGRGYLKSKMNSWYQMAQHQVMVVLTDLDRANCLVEFRDQWLVTAPPQNLLLRIAVREVESWVLADHVAMRALIGVKGVLPAAPDELADPKQSLLKLARSAPKDIRADLLKTIGGNLTQGLGYNARLTAWVNSEWSPQRAAERSPSLARARSRLNDVVGAFASPTSG